MITRIIMFVAPIVSFFIVLLATSGISRKGLRALWILKPVIVLLVWAPISLGVFMAMRKWVRVRAFRAWKETLRDDWRPGKEKGGLWGWMWKDRRSAEVKTRVAKRIAQYEMVSML